MDHKIRCRGGGSWNTWDAGIDNGPNLGPKSTPCGWIGKRHVPLEPAHMREAFEADKQRLLTAKPCPQCGGRVELVADAAS